MTEVGLAKILFFWLMSIQSYGRKTFGGVGAASLPLPLVSEGLMLSVVWESNAGINLTGYHPPPG